MPWRTRRSGANATSVVTKKRPRSDAATDGDRLGRVICDGGPDQTRAEPNRALLRRHDSGTYPQPGLCSGTRLFRGAQVPGKAAAAAQRPVIVSSGGIVGMADEIGD